MLANAGYQGMEKRVDEITKLNAKWCVAMRPGKRKALVSTGGADPRVLERLKASVRA